MGQPGQAYQLLDQAIVHHENAKGVVDQAIIVEAFLALEKGENHFHNDRAAAAGSYQHSLQLYSHLGDAWRTANALAGLGFIAHHAGNFKQAVEIYSAALDLHRTLGDPRGIAHTLVDLGQSTLRQGLVEMGEGYIKEGVAIFEQIGDMAGVVRGWFELARLYFWIGEFARSCELTEEASRIFNDLGILDQYIFASLSFGQGLSHLGKYSQAITTEISGIPLAQELGACREIGMAYVILGMAYLGQGDFVQAEEWARKGIQQYRDLHQREELTLALALLIYAQRRLGYSRQTRIYLWEILQLGLDTGGLSPILYALVAEALLLVDRGEVERGIEIYALAERYPFVEKSRWFEDIAGRELSAAAESLPPTVVAAARERGRGRDVWESAAELLGELERSS